MEGETEGVATLLEQGVPNWGNYPSMKEGTEAGNSKAVLGKEALLVNCITDPWEEIGQMFLRKVDFKL